MDLDQPGTPNLLSFSIPAPSSFQPSPRIPTELSHIPAASSATDVATASRPMQEKLPYYSATNVHPDAVLNTFLHYICVDLTCITASVCYEPETVTLQLEKIIQDIQDATSNYLINIHTHNTKLLDTYYET